MGLKWTIIIGCFYLAWGAIRYLATTEASLEEWRLAAMAHARSKGIDPPGRKHFAVGMLILMMCWWPFLRRI